MRAPKQEGSQPEAGDAPRWSLARIAGMALVGLAALAAIYLVVAFIAWESGQALRMQREEEQRVLQFARQIELAQQDIEGGSYNLALHRLDWVLQRDPANDEAAALRVQAQAALRTALTPEAPPVAVASPEPTVSLSDATDPDSELSRLQRLYERERWSDLLPAVLAFQRRFPNIERQESDRLLYESYLNLGVAQVQGEQIEQGIFYLSQAERLGDLPQDALDYWLWAELYLEGIAYYGVNWAVSSSIFRDLCVSAPFFQNACDKLYESLVNHAGLYLSSEDFCPAADLLREARGYGNDRNLGQNLTEAMEGCASATVTPAAITPANALTGTEAVPVPGE